MNDPQKTFSATFAFQPIVDIQRHTIFAYEALVRTKSDDSAGTVFSSLAADTLHEFDRDARVAAISLGSRLGLSDVLSLNFLPRALDTVPDSVSSTLDAAKEFGIASERLILEVTENEIIHDTFGFAQKINRYRSSGMRFAIDDFGAGYSGLNLLADFQPDLVKLDMNLVRAIDSKGPRQAIVRAVLQACSDLGVEVIAEGVETEPEFHWFRRHGVVLFQGYLFGRPAFEALPPANRFA